MIGQVLIAALLVVGGCFGLIGAWALLRLPDPMTRLHGPTKAATLGVGAVLIASMLYFWLAGLPSWHELLISIFLFISAPITGFYVAKANMHLIWRERDLPPPDGGAKWATYADPDKDG